MSVLCTAVRRIQNAASISADFFRGLVGQPDKQHFVNSTPRAFIASRTGVREGTARIFHAFILAILSLAFATCLRADTISGTVKDSSGAVVPGAHIEITGGNLPQPLVLTSDDAGKFTAPNLPPGKYSVRVTKDGFDEL